MDGIHIIAASLIADLKQRLPKQRKTQRTKLGVLVATMLDVRSANMMDLAAIMHRVETVLTGNGVCSPLGCGRQRRSSAILEGWRLGAWSGGLKPKGLREGHIAPPVM